MVGKQRDWVWAIRRSDGSFYSASADQLVPTLYTTKPWVYKNDGEKAIKVRIVEID